MKEVNLPDLSNDGRCIPFMYAGVQIYNIIEWAVKFTGPVDMVNTTFSVAEEFLRAVFRMKREGLILSATEVADLKSAAKTLRINNLLRQVFDEVYLAENHSKVVLLSNHDWKVTIITSQNQTRGNRNEAGIISTDPAVFDSLAKPINEMIKTHSVRWRLGEPLPNSLNK